MAWETFDFSEYVPTHVDKLIPGNKYVSLSTSDTLFRDTRWIISADYIVNSEDSVYKYIIGTIFCMVNNGIIPDYDDVTHNTVFCNKDRVFYEYNILLVEEYARAINKQFPSELVRYMAEY
jgi:hypothetical protein